MKVVRTVTYVGDEDKVRRQLEMSWPNANRHDFVNGPFTCCGLLGLQITITEEPREQVTEKD